MYFAITVFQKAFASVPLIILIFGCSEELSQRLIPERNDHVLWAGASFTPITPQVTESWTSCNTTNPNLGEGGKAMFHGSFDYEKGVFNEPMENPGCTKLCDVDDGIYCDNFTDTNRNGEFDAVWMAGFQNTRPANGVHDDIDARCLVLSYDSDYVIMCALDLMGILENRTRMVKEKLAPLGVDGDRVIIASTHNHEGPDALGIYGANESITGLSPGYLDLVVDRIVETVKTAASNMTQVSMKLGQRNVSDYCPQYCSGPDFTGLVTDFRDPKVIDDLVLVMKFEDLSGNTVATLVNWSNHVESMDSGNTLISSDYAGFLRKRMEMEYGGTSLFFASGVGGLSSPLRVPVPLRNEDGTTLTDTSSIPASLIGEVITDPVAGKVVTIISATDPAWERTRSFGYVVAETAISALESTDYYTGRYSDVDGLSVKASHVYLPLVNDFFNVAVSGGIFEMKANYLVKDPKLCPDLKEPRLRYRPLYGCLDDRIYIVTLGEAQIVTVPGEIFMELVRGLPDDFVCYEPIGTRPNKYFPDHNPDEIMSQHSDPYTIPPPIRPAMRAPFKFVFGLTNDEVGYIVPESDYVFTVTDDTMDHYEETRSLGPKTATIVLDKVHELLNSP